MVIRRGMALAGIGVLAGVIGATALTRIVASMLYGVTAFDAVTFASVPVILATVALLACLIPAARAAAVEPVTALREE
jgi:ABC-type antimicrobial peptide transport system permease subunit